MSEETQNPPQQPWAVAPTIPASGFNNVNAAPALPPAVPPPLPDAVQAAEAAVTQLVEKASDELVALSPAVFAAEVIDPLAHLAEAKIIDGVTEEGYKVVEKVESDNVFHKLYGGIEAMAHTLHNKVVNIEAHVVGDVAHLKTEIKDDFTEAKQKVEAVVHPAHYNSHPSGVEAIEIIQHFTFNVGTAVKHLWRAGLKGGTTELLLQDLSKARQYIDFEIAKVKKLVEGVDAPAPVAPTKGQ